MEPRESPPQHRKINQVHTPNKISKARHLRSRKGKRVLIHTFPFTPVEHRIEVANNAPRSITKIGPGHNQTVPQLALITEVTFRVDVDNKTSPFMNTPIQAHPNKPVTNKSEHPISLRLPPKG
jgi:hypothetical protein